MVKLYGIRGSSANHSIRINHCRILKIVYLEVPVVGCSDDDWWTNERDVVEDEDDEMGDDSSDDGGGVHGRTTISGSDNIFRLNLFASTQNMLSLS